MSKIIILVADGLGIGGSDDAKEFQDEGANTFLHIHQHRLKNNKPLNIPNLTKLGLVKACEQANQTNIDLPMYDIMGSYGYMQETSSGKDTPSGHWEMAGVPVLFDWGYFPNKKESFPEELINKITERTGVKGILGNRHAPGTDILNWLGQEHIETGKPICYTSVDSVFQIAAHEEHFGLQNLYKFCEQVREILDEYNIGRVIARPFVGEQPDEFVRTGNRRDFSVLPPEPTVLQHATEKGVEVVGIGKISDIFAHQGISKPVKATGLEQLIDTTISEIKQSKDNSIIFTNLVNFDQDYGHRRDIDGFAEALEYFDNRLSDLFLAMAETDRLFITADHGCDPSWHGTEHTRECVPILTYQKSMPAVELGRRATFADLGQTIAENFNLAKMSYGTSFHQQLMRSIP